MTRNMKRDAEQQIIERMIIMTRILITKKGEGEGSWRVRGAIVASEETRLNEFALRIRATRSSSLAPKTRTKFLGTPEKPALNAGLTDEG